LKERRRGIEIFVIIEIFLGENTLDLLKDKNLIYRCFEKEVVMKELLG